MSGGHGLATPAIPTPSPFRRSDGRRGPPSDGSIIRPSTTRTRARRAIRHTCTSTCFRDVQGRGIGRRLHRGRSSMLLRRQRRRAACTWVSMLRTDGRSASTPISGSSVVQLQVHDGMFLGLGLDWIPARWTGGRAQRRGHGERRPDVRRPPASRRASRVGRRGWRRAPAATRRRAAERGPGWSAPT